MSYHSKQPVPPVRYRSHSAARSSGNSYNNRPRSLGLYNTTPTYTSPYSSNINPYSSPYNNYTTNYKSPYLSNGYRNNSTSSSSGYASITIPAKSLANINLRTPNYTKTYNDRNSYIRNDISGGHRSRRDMITRRGSYNNDSISTNNVIRDRSLSRSRTSLASSSNGMGSKSASLTSLNSEGYYSGNEKSKRNVNNTTETTNENGEIIDYKKLYEQAMVENEQLREKLRKSDAELRDTKQTLERINAVTSKNSLSELEKRERRAMERKLSEMEEELKQLQKLKAENERLKADNRSLTRVITKLTNSPKK